MLKSIGIRGFKSFREAELQLAPLTVMIGANASGKSNALEALRLLAWIARGNRLGSIRYAVQEADRAIRGRVQDLGFRGVRSFRLACRTDVPAWERLEIELSVDSEGELHITDERIFGDERKVPLYEVVGHPEGLGNDLSVAYDNFARGGRKPRMICTDQTAVFLQLQSAARFEAGHSQSQKTIPAVGRQYERRLAGIYFLDPDPSAMRGWSFRTEPTLAEDGSNLSGVLSNLIEEDESHRSVVLDFVRSLPEQDIAELDFIETPRGEVMVYLVETFGGTGETYDATLLSDGTLRVLSIAAALLSAPPFSLVVIEEIDNGVHPSRAVKLLGSIATLASERSLRVLISSHNPALLDALPDGAVPNVVFCYRDPTDGASCLVRLRDVPDYPELIAQGSIGHLMTTGLLERFVKHHPSPEEKKARALEWLESLRSEAAEA